MIGECGSVGDYIDSLARLEAFRLAALLPGHSELSEAAQEDIGRALKNARELLGRERRLDLVRLGGEPWGRGRVAGAGGAREERPLSA